MAAFSLMGQLQWLQTEPNLLLFVFFILDIIFFIIGAKLWGLSPHTDKNFTGALLISIGILIILAGIYSLEPDVVSGIALIPYFSVPGLIAILLIVKGLRKIDI